MGIFFLTTRKICPWKWKDYQECNYYLPGRWGKTINKILLKLLPNTARGGYDNGGDVGGSYHIHFSAYVNDNPKQSLKVELYFTDASISPLLWLNPIPSCIW